MEEAARSIDDLLQRLGEAEARLGTLAAEVEHLQRLAMVGTLAAGIVHEINNILTPALGEAQAARRRTNDPERIHRALDQCVLSITQAGKVSGTLIDFSLPSKQQRRAGAQSKPAANIAQAVSVTLQCLGRRPQEQGVSIAVQVPPDAWVEIEPLALQQVILNLLLNALHALKGHAGATIQISAAQADDGLTEITLTDNGPGIPVEIRETLFEPFTTAAVSDRASKGTGLGLTISKRLVQMAGGTIQVGSQKQGGATFTIRLNSICRTSCTKAA